jgi:hypothetical protein
MRIHIKILGWIRWTGALAAGRTRALAAGRTRALTAGRTRAAAAGSTGAAAAELTGRATGLFRLASAATAVCFSARPKNLWCRFFLVAQCLIFSHNQPFRLGGGGCCFTLRIGSGFNRVSGSGFGIRIRNPDPDPGGQKLPTEVTWTLFLEA